MLQLDGYSRRFLGMGIQETRIDIDEEDYFAGITPEEYLVHALLPSLKHEWGADFVDEVVGESAMWGSQAYVINTIREQHNHR